MCTSICTHRIIFVSFKCGALFSSTVHLPVFHFKIGYGIVCKLHCIVCWRLVVYFCWKWMANTVYCCVWPAFGVHIFCSLWLLYFFFLFKTPSPTFIYITENREHKRAHIESCCLICVVVHVLIENNVFRIRNCTCRCVIVYVYVLCSNTNQIRWAETVLIVVGVVVAAVHCAITAKRQQIKQKLICLLTKDHTST